MPLILLLMAVLLATADVARADPAITAAPAVSGSPQVGVELRADDAQVDEAVAQDLTVFWERSTGEGFSEIPDATGSTYTPTVADLGHRLRLRAVLETASGADEAWSEPTEPVTSRSTGRLRIGPEPHAPLRLARWVVTAGDRVRISGALGVEAAAADAQLVLDPIIPGTDPIDIPIAIDATGRVTGDVDPAVNAVVWLELRLPDAASTRIRLGVVGVRPRIDLVLGASADGRDGAGRPLIRDLRVLPGSILAPGMAGLRLLWEGKLPGDRTGTAVCRSAERVVSGPGGALRGACRTRGAWASARWRLVLDPGAGPLSAPFLPARSAWVVPRIGSSAPVLPRRTAGGGPAARLR